MAIPKDEKLEKWFNSWFNKKKESDYLFPGNVREWLWLAFLAGAHTVKCIDKGD